jgi:antitoxin ParD1/3/4
MSTMNISLPDDMKEFIDRQVSERGYGTSSEFLRDLIRKEQERLHLRSLMLQAMSSPRAGEADAAYFKGLRERVATKVAAKSKPSSRRVGK